MMFSERVAALTPEQRRAAEQMVVDNEGLARWGANRYMRVTPWLSFDEVYGLMLEALWRSAMMWKPEKSRFSTYAAIWMRQTAFYQRARYKPGGLTRAPENEETLSLDFASGDNGDMYCEIADSDAFEIFYVEDIIVQSLEERERRIVVAVVAGFSPAEIAQREGICTRLVARIADDAVVKLEEAFAA